MELKKNPNVDLNKQRSTFTQIGAIVSLALSLLAFNSASKDEVATTVASTINNEVEQIDIPQTEQIKTPPPPAAPPQLTIVADNEVLEDQQMESSEITQDTYIPPVDLVVTGGDEETVQTEEEVFTVVEDQPSFPGGDGKLLEFLGKNIKYPSLAKENNIQGMVVLTFVIEKDGSVSDVKVLRGIGGGCDEEAMRVTRSMPRWSAGKQRGQSVRVQFNLPVRFVLQQ